MTRPALLALALVGLLGCPSAYDRTYQRESQRLEEGARLEEQREAERHAEASRYAAVVTFPLGSAQLDEDAKRELRWLVEKLAPFPEAHLEVQGFADATGGEARNQELSRERAENVASYLALEGIHPTHLHVQGFSSSVPAAPDATAEGRRRNRRVEVTVR